LSHPKIFNLAQGQNYIFDTDFNKSLMEYPLVNLSKLNEVIDV